MNVTWQCTPLIKVDQKKKKNVEISSSEKLMFAELLPYIIVEWRNIDYTPIVMSRIMCYSY